MTADTGAYRSDELSFVVPTKDRPGEMRNLLESLAGQTARCGRVVVVASGEDIRDVVLGFADRLPIEYKHSEQGGQIYQRNLGLGMLGDETRLVGSLDDDVVLEADAVEGMLSFWNGAEVGTAGVSFNIVNAPPFRHSLLKALFGMSSSVQGRVLRSGYNVAGAPVDRDLKVDWLCGGATVWRRDILDRFRNREVASRWAICEDVIFSYPIGKQHPLYVCADARARHEHVYDHKATMKYRYYGRTATLWRLHFVESHEELSRGSFFWMIFGQLCARAAAGIFLLRRNELEYVLGMVEGLGVASRTLLRGGDILVALVEE
ncbi:glycosyltransferase family 2 protein [Verrucomicrobiota bacterium]